MSIRYLFLPALLLPLSALSAQCTPSQMASLQQQILSQLNQPDGRHVIAAPLKQANTVQAIASDNRRSVLYAAKVVKAKPETVVLTAYRYDGGNTLKPWHMFMPSENLGHQGLAVQQTHNGIYFWGSQSSAVKNWGFYVIRFRVDSDGQVADVTPFRLFPDKTYRNAGNTTPTVSADNRYLIARGRLQEKGYSAIHVFDLAGISPDLPQPLAEWALPPSFTAHHYPFQGMASDGRFVYLISGDGDTGFDKQMLIYTLQGQQVFATDKLQTGKADAMATGKGESWEPEGLNLMRLGQRDYLNVSINAGNPGRRSTFIYRIALSRLQPLLTQAAACAE
ncbi:phage baseplate protein [Neisseria perflava]|uniref:phage baseplate protein n=1 Tax=Neisseria perflava TaxID=33053 RepID=UPI00209CA43A|nr:hypothetical protein [Neisseria perflava]MCP1661135.1 hypothetical protein [Neisseria perflava]MCP1772818.1 hypothetical protein [Neisseria perflava]